MNISRQNILDIHNPILYRGFIIAKQKLLYRYQKKRKKYMYFDDKLHLNDKQGKSMYTKKQKNTKNATTGFN